MESELSKRAKHEVKRFRGWILKTIYILVGLYFITDFILFFVATPILKNYLQEKIYKQTNGLFSVDFENISIEIGSRRIALKKFELIPDSTVYNKLAKQKENIPALYKISCNSLEIWKLSVYNLLVKRVLKASELKLIDLVIELQQLPNSGSNESSSRDFVHEDLYPAISNYLSEIKIKQIKVVNGRFKLNLSKNESKKTTHLGFISIKLFNFLLNQEEFKKRNRLFFSDDLQINIDEYRINLSDNLHFIYAQDLNISTKESMLTAKNAGISLLNQKKLLSQNIENNYYKANTPFIEINHFNLFELYFNQDINIGKIYLKKPKLTIYSALKTGKLKSVGLTKSKDIDFSKLIAGKLNSIQVDTFQIENGSMNYYLGSATGKPAYHAKSLSLALFHFKLDDNSFNDKSKLLYADNITLNIGGFSTLLPDKLHFLEVSSIDLSTFDKSFKAADIRLKPISEKTDVDAFMKIDIPYLEMSGTDFYQLYHERIFNISNLSIGNSVFDIGFIKKAKVNSENGQQRNILSILTSNFLNQLSIRNFNLMDSKFQIKNTINDSISVNYQGEAMFSLSNFFIDEECIAAQESKLFYSDQFKLKLKDYQQNLKDRVHQLNAKTIEVSTEDSLIEVIGLTVHKNDKAVNLSETILNKWIFDFNLIQVSIKGIDINKAYNDSNLYANSISIFYPEIKIDNHINFNKLRKEESDTSYLDEFNHKRKNDGIIANLMASYFTEIKLNAFNIENADFTLFDVDSIGNKEVATSAKFSARLNQFILSNKDSVYDQLLFSDNISFKITDYFSKIFDKRYQMKIKQARFSSKDSSFSAFLVRIFPDPVYEKSLETNSFWSFYAPEIITTQTNISEFLNSNILNLGILKISNPSIVNTQLVRTDSLQKRIKEKIEKKPFLFKKVKLDGVEIENGVFGMMKKKETSESLLLNSKFEFQADAFSVDSSSFSDLSVLLSGLNSIVKFEDISYLMPDSLHLLKLENLELNTGEKTVYGDSLHYFPAIKLANFQEKPGLEELFLPEFRLTGFSLEKLFLSKSILAGDLNIVDPEFSVLSKPKLANTKGFNMSGLDLYSKINKRLNAIELNTIHIDNVKLNITPANQAIRETKTFTKLFIDVQNFILDSLNRNKNKILNADDVKLLIKDYSYTFPNNLYTLYLKELGISTGKNLLFANGINLNPNMERKEYANEKQKETTLLYVNSKGATMRGFNIPVFLENGNLSASQLDVFDVQFHAYKNKQYPLDSVLKPVLPHEFIFKTKKHINLDTVNIHNSYFSNEVLGANAKENGFIDITNINASIYNLTNSSQAIKDKGKTTMLASGYLMDKSLFTASFRFPLDSKNGEYYYGGELDSFDIKELNPLLENMYFVSVKDGEINNLNFNVSANSVYSDGELTMTYDNLKVELLNKKKSDSLDVEKRGLFSMVANSVIRNSNPRSRNGFVREGEIYFERNIYKTVYNYWIGSLLSGMKSTLGFKSKQLKERLKLEKLAEKFNRKTTRKTERKDRKEEKNQKKQIEKDIKLEQRKRKKSGKEDRKSQRKDVSFSEYEKNKIWYYDIPDL